MKVLGWIFRLLIVALGVALFVLQSPYAKKSILEALLNKAFTNTSYKMEVDDIRGLFPFQFSIASIALKDGDTTLAALPEVYATWNMLALLGKRIKVELNVNKQLEGEVVYRLSSSALVVRLEGDGIAVGKQLVLKSVDVNFPKLALLKGEINTSWFDGREIINLNAQVEEQLSNEFRIPVIQLKGQNIEGQGHIRMDPKGLWEGQVTLSIPNLTAYDHWFEKGLMGSATLQVQKDLKSPISGDLVLENFHYAQVQANTLKGHVSLKDLDHATLDLQGQDVLLNSIPLTQLTAVGTLNERQGKFEIKGKGEQEISLTIDGTYQLPTVQRPETHINIARAQLHHPFHQFALKQPVKVTYSDKAIQIPILGLVTGGGAITLQNITLAETLSGSIVIERLPLTLLRLIDPDWIASGDLSGKGKLEGTRERPEAELVVEGKSLRWGLPQKTSKDAPGRSLGVDISSTVHLRVDSVAWHLKMGSSRLATLLSEGTMMFASSAIEATLKGQTDLGIISLLIPYGDLIQGQSQLDLTVTGTLHDPQINGRLIVTKGMYENAEFGTFIKNINVQGRASGNTFTLSQISGQDNAKGSVTGHGSLKFSPLFSPHVDLTLKLNQLIVIQNDELSGKASGDLRLHGVLNGEPSAKITGDIVIQPFEVRLDEQATKIATIKLKDPDKPFESTSKIENPNPPKSTILPLDIRMKAPGKLFIRGYGFDGEWKGEMRALGPISDAHLVGEITLVKGRFDLLGKTFKLKKEGRIVYSEQPANDPLLDITGTRNVKDITANMHIKGRASNPKVTFSSTPPLPQEEILARLLFGKGMDTMSVPQNLVLGNALSTLKGKSKLNFTDKIRSAFGLEMLEFKEKKTNEGDEFTSASQYVSVSKEIYDGVSLSLDQSVRGEGGTSATVQVDLSKNFKVEADVGGDKNAGIGFAWVKKY